MTDKSTREIALESEASAPLLTRLRWAKVLRDPEARRIQRALAATRLYGEQAEREAEHTGEHT